MLRPSTWRETVNATWSFIEREYLIEPDDYCSTHVHVSKKEPYTLQELKLIAQAVLWWEPAWEAILPDERRYVKRNVP